MTDEEALALKPGQQVELNVRGEWVKAEVLYVKQFPGRDYVKVTVQRHGTHIDTARPFNPRSVANMDYLRLPPSLSPVVANVFADWLDERGHHEAARDLREAFPRVDAEGKTT